MASEFPERVYTEDEVRRARALVEGGYRHRLAVKGGDAFRRKVEAALSLVRTAGYWDFLTAYIRAVVEIDGLTQLRETEATVWANGYAVEDPVEAASLLVQKAYVMKEFLESKLYYGGEAELRSVEKRLEFLEALKARTDEATVKARCEELLRGWREIFMP